MGHPPTRREQFADSWEFARRDVLDLAGRLIPKLDDPAYTEASLYADVEGFTRWHLMIAVWQLAAELAARGLTSNDVVNQVLAMQLSDVDR